MKKSSVFLLAVILFSVILLSLVYLAKLYKGDGGIIANLYKGDGGIHITTILPGKNSHDDKTVSESVAESVNDDEYDVSTINPGCIKKKLSKYRAPDINDSFYDHPPIVHYVKLYKSINDTEHIIMSINFREYISVLSVHKFLKPKRMIFHTFSDFAGKYWEIIRTWKEVEMNVIAPFDEIGGKFTEVVQHKADYIKLNMIYDYGGTALDFDVIMVNGTRWKYLQSKSECVLVEEKGIVNGGLYSCIKNSSFVAKWLDGYHTDYRPRAWLHNASRMPLYILQGDVCYNIHVDRTVCLNPTYGQHLKWLKVNGAVWRSKTAIHYYVKKGIPHDGVGLLKEKFSLAEVVQYVYNA